MLLVRSFYLYKYVKPFQCMINIGLSICLHHFSQILFAELILVYFSILFLRLMFLAHMTLVAKLTSFFFFIEELTSNQSAHISTPIFYRSWEKKCLLHLVRRASMVVMVKILEFLARREEIYLKRSILTQLKELRIACIIATFQAKVDGAGSPFI